MDIELIKSLLESAGTDMGLIQFQNLEENSVTLRYGYWNKLPEEVEESFSLSIKDDYDIKLEDDGEPNRGKRSRYFYEIAKK